MTADLSWPRAERHSIPNRLRSMTARSVSALLSAAAQAVPSRTAVIDAELELDYADLDRAVSGLACALVECGTRPGDIVSLELPSSADFIVAALAILRSGACVSAINTRLGPGEQQSILERTRPRIRIVRDEVDQARTITQTKAREAWSGPALDLSIDRALEDPACIVWTSGTTGMPKGAVYSTEAMHAISEAIGAWSITEDVRLITLPFAHVGFMTRLVDELSKRVTMVVGAEPWSAVRQLREIERCHVTVAGGVPTQWQAILASPELAHTDLSSLRVVGIGAAPATPELIHAIREAMGCPIIARYTSTEAGITTGTQLGDDPEVVAHSIGKPAPGVEIRIVSSDASTGVEPGQEGELCCRSRSMMREYFNDPMLTAETIDADGFLHTGDLVKQRPDGNIVILGRTKEMFIRGGYNVYPVEVEAALSGDDRIAALAVIPRADDRLGEIGIACIVPRDSANIPTLAELKERCALHIADYKAPDGILALPSLPLTAMGKIDRARLRTEITHTRSTP